MNSGYVWVRRKPASRLELVTLLKKLTDDWKIAAYRYQEHFDVVELAKADIHWGEKLEGSAVLGPNGRVFCKQFELCWQATASLGEQHYELQVISEQDWSLSPDEWMNEVFEASTEYSTYLWGERKGEELVWTATRIPQAQAYPISLSADKTMAAIRVKQYRQNGLTRLTRLICVEAISKPKE